MDGCGPAEVDAWLSLSRVHALLADRLDEALQEEVGLSLVEHQLLVQVVTAGGGLLRMGDVARTLVLSKSGITRLVAKLEEQGLVERVTFADDRRATYAQITTAGARVVDESQPVFARVLGDVFAANLTQTDVRNLQRALGKLLDAHGWRPPPCPAAAAELRSRAGRV